MFQKCTQNFYWQKAKLTLDADNLPIKYFSQKFGRCWSPPSWRKWLSCEWMQLVSVLLNQTHMKAYESLLRSADALADTAIQTNLTFSARGPFWAIAGSFNGVDVFKSWSSPSLGPVLCKRRSLSALSAWTERVLLSGLSLREGSFRRLCGASVAGPSVFVYWVKAGSPSLLISASGIVLIYGSCRCDWMSWWKA